MRQNTPTHSKYGVKIYHRTHDGMIVFSDPWLVIDDMPSSVYGSHLYYMSCTFSDMGAAFGHSELDRGDADRQGNTVSWSHVPLAVRHAIIADHPEWAGTVWTV